MPRKKKVVEEQPFPSIFEHLGIKPVKPGVEEKPVQDATKPAPDTGALLARIESLTSQIGDLQSRIAAPQGYNPAPQPAKDVLPVPEIDLAGMPDPVENPAEYQKVLSQRIAKVVDAGVGVRLAAHDTVYRAQQADAAKRDALWETFQEKYEDLSEYQDHVEIAATKVVKKAMRNGLDPERYMFVTTDKFLNDVAEETRRLVGPLLKTVSNDEGEDGQAKGDGLDDDGPDDDERTAGIFTGTPAKPDKGKQETAYPSLTEDLTKIQRETGYY